MNPLRVVTLTDGRYRHLGSTVWGGRTACGVRFQWNGALIEQVGSVNIGCLRCQRSHSYRMAEARGEL